jgi:hypothetical protein
LGARSEGHQHRTFFERLLDWNDLSTRHDQARGSCSELTASRAKTSGTGYEDTITQGKTGARASFSNPPYCLVPRHDRITKSRLRRRLTTPKQALSARADAAPLDIDHHVVIAWLTQRKTIEGDATGFVQNDRERFALHGQFRWNIKSVSVGGHELLGGGH